MNTCFVRPDLGPNSLQRLQQMTLVGKESSILFASGNGSYSLDISHSMHSYTSDSVETCHIFQANLIFASAFLNFASALSKVISLKLQ